MTHRILVITYGSRINILISATGGEAADGTADDTATGDDTALDGQAAAATGNSTGIFLILCGWFMLDQ